MSGSSVMHLLYFSDLLLLNSFSCGNVLIVPFYFKSNNKNILVSYVFLVIYSLRKNNNMV